MKRSSVSLHSRIHDPVGPRRLRTSCAAKRGAPNSTCARDDGAAPTIQRVAAVEASRAGAGAQQQRQRAAVGCRKRQPPYRHRVDLAMAQFADHRGDGAAAQRFLHRPQQIARAARRRPSAAARRKAEGIEAGAVRRAAFGERHVLGDPAHARPVRCAASPSAKPVAAARWASLARGDLVQRAARQAAAKRVIDRSRCRTEGRPDRPQSRRVSPVPQRWRNCSSIVKPLATRRYSVWRVWPGHRICSLFVLVCRRLETVKPQGKGMQGAGTAPCLGICSATWSPPRIGGQVRR